MRPWERAGQPKSTGWPTTWPKTTAPRAAATPLSQGSGAKSEGVCQCVGGPRCAKESGWQPPIFKGNLAEYRKPEQIHPHILYIKSKIYSSQSSYLAHILTVPLLTLHHSSMVPPIKSRFTVLWHFWGIMVGKVVARFAQAQQLMEHTSQRKGTEAPALPTLNLQRRTAPPHPPTHRAGLSSTVIWSGWISGLQTWLVQTLKRGMRQKVLPYLWTVLKYSGDNRWVWTGRMDKKKKKKKSDPHVLNTTPSCAQRPQEVQLNSLAPAASKCASKTAGRLYFFNEFSFFFCHLRIYHETSMCQTTLIVHKETLCVRE